MKTLTPDRRKLPLQDRRFKQLFKEALTETLEENRGLFSDLFAEAIEEVALTRAIEEGQRTRNVSRKSVMKLLGKSA
ncbi:MAG: hypothetical protein V2A74_13825 [bacterium]